MGQRLRGERAGSRLIFLALHLPDGFMTVPLAALGWAAVVPALGWALARSSGRDEDQETVLAALLAAFLFAAQTLHFPVPGGTSGHLVGATLVTILCGPALGLLVLTSVVVLQAFVFGDGGLFTLGWNLTNMGLVAGLLGGALFSGLRQAKCPLAGSAFLAAWTGTMLGALCTGLELAAARITPIEVSLGAMLGVQAIMGLLEGAVTASALVFLNTTRPQLLAGLGHHSARPGLLVAALLVGASCLPPTVYGLSPNQFYAPIALVVLAGLAAAAGLVLRLGARLWDS